ncbi:zinc finger protein 823-like [Folsomia candida]|uniref:zinc finger protein 823-like n=1 Tax=Folsomia candida TaxID=158441 RepID=UPI001604D561|nr:zinc finger protein 823-like [Folsomia candida]
MQLQQHIPTHTTEKPYNCATCGKSFTLRGNMKRHEETHLEKSTRDRLQCQVCTQTFLSKLAVQRHVRAVHENRKKYPCEFCDKGFSKPSNLEGHVEAKHATNKDLIHSCDKCEYKSYSKFNLAYHVRRHNPANLRECYFCGKQFVMFQELVRHSNRLHTLEV